MISAKRFAQSEPVLFKATQDFVQSFADVPDPVVFISSKAKSIQGKIAWTILGGALFQDLEYSNVMRILAALYKAFPEERLWTLPVPKEEDLQSVANTVLQGQSWSLKEHLPGIFWSVGNFVRHHQNDLVQWAASRNAEEIWRDLGEIYFMGKGKPRPKAAATIYRLIAKYPLGIEIAIGKSRALPPIPMTMGIRRFMSILGPGKYVKFSEVPPEEKQKASNQLLTELAPNNPLQASHGLQYFLEQGTKEFICREHFKICSKCPLFKFCKYAVQK